MGDILKFDREIASGRLLQGQVLRCRYPQSEAVLVAGQAGQSSDRTPEVIRDGDLVEQEAQCFRYWERVQPAKSSNDLYATAKVALWRLSVS